MTELPPSKRRKTHKEPSTPDDAGPSTSDNKIIQFEEPSKVFIDMFEFIDELKSYLTENVGLPIKLLIVFYGLIGCSNDDTYLKLGDMLSEIGIKSEVFDGDEGDNETMEESYDSPNATCILDTRGLSIEETRQYQRDAIECGAIMQFVYYDKPDMMRLRNDFVFSTNFDESFIIVSDIRKKLVEYPDNSDCVAILNDQKHLMDFTICVRANTLLDFVYVAKIFTTYLYKKEEIFQVPSLEDL